MGTETIIRRTRMECVMPPNTAKFYEVTLRHDSASGRYFVQKFSGRIGSSNVDQGREEVGSISAGENRMRDIIDAKAKKGYQIASSDNGDEAEKQQRRAAEKQDKKAHKYLKGLMADGSKGVLGF
jgi:predicted DNA-binding WGR domain protein